MAQVRVYNDNKFVYKERFMDEDIVIEPGKFITMDEQKAVRFRGTQSPVELDHDGNPTPQSYKMIRLEKIDSNRPEKVEDKFLCMACGDESFQSQKALDAHIDEKHQDQWADLDHKEKKQKAQGKEKHA